jgi:cytosine/adenosine deaminase-related metal-dependent hydrolase
VRFIKAVKIFDGERFLEPAAVLVFDDKNRLQNITTDHQVPAEKIEFLEGILTPGFINAHCHLELSHLRSLISKGTGFTAFAIDLMDKRGKISNDKINEAMAEAERQMIGKGIVAVGDISNNEISIAVKREKKLHYHTFVELIGLNPVVAPSIFEKGVRFADQIRAEGLDCSLTPHAPYSVSNELIGLIAAENKKRDLPLTIHNQESVEEHLFFMGKQSKVHELYQHLNINIDFFVPPRKSSLASYLPLLEGEKNLLVHNTFSRADDVKAGQTKKVFWCFCPGANLYIENQLPDFKKFMDDPSFICIGTDSLASNDKLDVIAELNTVAENLPPQNDEVLLAMICTNGARALGIDTTYGKLIMGRNAGLNLIRKSGSKFELIKKIF